jgi:hypothetical protein
MSKTRDYDEIIRRNKAFVHMEPVDRPLLGIWVGSEMPLEQYKRASEVFSSFKGSAVVPETINPKDFLDDYDRLFLEHEQVGDDLLWSASPLIGFPWMEAIVGIPVHASQATYWTTPCLNSWDELNEVNFSLENKWFQKLLEFKEVLIEHTKGRYPLATSFAPVRGIGDMMSAALGQEKMILELYDNPDNVKKLASIYTDIWVKVAKAQIEKTPKFHNGYILAFYNIWTPSYCQYMQEDSLAYLSPRFYREILLKNHIKMVNSCGYSFMHLHTDGLYCLDELYKMENLKIIDVTRDLVGLSAFELLPVLKEIQKHKPLLIWGDLTREEIKELLNALSPRGLCICPVVKTLEEGKDLMRRMKKKNL